MKYTKINSILKILIVLMISIFLINTVSYAEYSSYDLYNLQKKYNDAKSDDARDKIIQEFLDHENLDSKEKLDAYMENIKKNMQSTGTDKDSSATAAIIRKFFNGVEAYGKKKYENNGSDDDDTGSGGSSGDKGDTESGDGGEKGEKSGDGGGSSEPGTQSVITGFDAWQDQAQGFIEKGNNGAKISIQEAITSFLPIGRILVGVASIVLVAVGGIFGVKYMLAGANEKAQMKEKLIFYVISIVLVYGAVGIFSIFVTVMNNILS